MIEMDPAKINDADRYVESKILEAGEAYAESNKRQKVENKKRAENRAKIKDLGVGTYAYQVAVKICKDLTETERGDFLRDLDVLVRVLGPKQKDLFADELIKAEKRAQRQAEKAAKVTGKEGAPDPDNNPRSDPNAGGAKPQTEEKPWPDDVAAADAAAFVESEKRLREPDAPPDVPGEQAEGEAALAAAMPKTKQAQSAKAAEKLAAAKLN